MSDSASSLTRTSRASTTYSRSGEQDFLLSNTCEFSRLVGFNISERQVRYANERAIREHVAHKLSFRLGEAERLPGVADSSVPARRPLRQFSRAP
jgi:hypothetical protein